MDSSKMKPETTAFWVTTDVGCSDPELGKLLGTYLFEALPPEKHAAFERHLDQCIACWTDVTNWKNLGWAAKQQPSSASKHKGKNGATR